MSLEAQPISIAVGGDLRVSGLLQVPAAARACYVFAHGAGAGMAHPFMTAIAQGLAERSVATLRYQFPYMERGSRRPDVPAVAHAAVRAAVGEASRLVPTVPLIAGGKSFGGRMTSQAQASSPLRNVAGLAFLGFPLHPAGRPSIDRAAHLDAVRIPMLFLQGTRDELANLDLLKGTVAKRGTYATLVLVDEGDHSFHVPAKSGRRDADVRREMLDAFVAWMDAATASDDH